MKAAKRDFLLSNPQTSMLSKKHTIVSDQELIRKSLEGNEEACRLLFEKYYGRMLNVCKRYAKDNDEAKDMVQEGFIQVFKSLKKFGHLGSFEGWIRKIMVNTSINYLKKFHLHQTVEYVDQDVLVSFEDAGIENNIDDAELLLQMIRCLSPAYRAVFNLAAVEGYSHFEIAEILNIKESTSRSNLAKAREKLQQMIQQKGLTVKYF